MRLIDADKLLDRLPKVDLDHDEKITRSGAIMDMIYMVETAPTVEVPRWIPATERLPDKEEFVLVVVNGRWHNIKFVNAAQIAMYDEDGWWIEAYPEWKNPKVSHWMPLPSAPEAE